MVVSKNFEVTEPIFGYIKHELNFIEPEKRWLWVDFSKHDNMLYFSMYMQRLHILLISQFPLVIILLVAVLEISVVTLISNFQTPIPDNGLINFRGDSDLGKAIRLIIIYYLFYCYDYKTPLLHPTIIILMSVEKYSMIISRYGNDGSRHVVLFGN